MIGALVLAAASAALAVTATNRPKAGTPIAASMATDPRSSRLRLKARAQMLCPIIR